MSRKKNSKAHRWTDDELELLWSVMEDSKIQEVIEVNKRQRSTSSLTKWDVIATALMCKGGPVVTGSACSRQAYNKRTRKGRWKPRPSVEEAASYYGDGDWAGLVTQALEELKELMLLPHDFLLPTDKGTLEYWVGARAGHPGRMSGKALVLSHLKDINENLRHELV